MAGMGKAGRLAAIAFAAGILAFHAASAPALAQAGSVGGTIGQTDKSVSGGQAAPAQPSQGYPRKPRHLSAARPASAASSEVKTSAGDSDKRPSIAPSNESLPKTIRLIEHTILGDYTVTLQNVGGSYAGTWNHGYVTKFTVTTFTKDSLKMERHDDPAFAAVSGTYIGLRAGDGAHGQATISNGFITTWDASW